MLVLFLRSSEYYSMKQQISGVKSSAAAIMRVLGASALIAGSMVVPNLGSTIAPLIRKQAKLSDQEVERALRYTMKQGWVGYREKNNQVEVYLTRSGKARWQKIELDRPLTSSAWDGRWRIVIFDIPSRRRLRRDALRNQLKKIGFRQLQESVWITPHDCSELIATLKIVFGLRSEEVKLIEAASFEGQITYMQLFGLERR